jgi:hypothetical protein
MSAEIDERDRQRRAKRYEAIHNGIFVVETVYTILLLLAFLFSGRLGFAGPLCAVEIVQPMDLRGDLRGGCRGRDEASLPAAEFLW